MTIELHLYATLRRYWPDPKPGETPLLKLPNAMNLGQLLDYLHLPPTEVKTLFVNGRKQSIDYILCDGDRVGIFPPVGGG